ncbi:leucyl aminopeptidase, partial [candidate division WOR-3 bacterium]|nr:leucyl aminopeptidase [candidate division WOR-3 bacterium]
MFDIREYYSEANDKIRESYEKTLSAVRGISGKAGEYEKGTGKKELDRFLATVGKMILKYAGIENELKPDFFTDKDMRELKTQNLDFYSDILPENYPESYANPTYAVRIFGERLGRLFSFLYWEFRRYLTYAFSHKVFKMERYNRLFIELWEYLANNEADYDYLKGMITGPRREQSAEDYVRAIKEQFDPGFRYLREVIEEADLSDPRYLFASGGYITENEIGTSRFLATYSRDKIEKLARQIVKGYIEGFERDGKDISNKSSVRVVYGAGQERIIKEVARLLSERGLEPSGFNAAYTRPNKQYDFDFKFSPALYLDEAHVERVGENLKQACESCREVLESFSGIVALDKFGEEPFKPENKKEMLRFSPEQQELFMSLQATQARVFDSYAPRTKTSFTVIAFPSPEIGDNFNEIFEDVLEINMLDTEKYEVIQQRIIDALDKADFVHVKGKGSNKTDIKVKLHELTDPARQSNFLNCGANINIPLGEVYTSPVLKGTTGVLHVKETFLNRLKFVDLELHFKDGYVVDYNCGNFEKEEDNKRYIEENLLFPHKTLPVGEFAIGTNTLAYVMAQKHRILDVLPVL